PFGYAACRLASSQCSPEEVPMRDFSIPLTRRPGEIARVSHALARKGVNLRSLTAMAFGGQGLMRLIADDVEAARSALEEGRIPSEETELNTVLLENQAGAVEDIAAKLAN